MTQNTQNGYICLPRGWMDTPGLGDDREPLCRKAAWLWLLENARWSDGETYIGGRRVVVRRGEMVVSVRAAAKEWRWSPQAAHRFVQRLVAVGHILVDTGMGLGHITICNYDTICGHGNDNGTASVQQRYADGTSIKKGRREEERKNTPLPPADLFAEVQPPAAGGVVEELIPRQSRPHRPAPQPAADAGFDAFMAEYPKRTDRDGAKKAYQKLIREGVSPDEILAGVRRTQFPEARYAQKPGNWLADRQWMPPPAAAPKQYRYF